MLTLGTQTNHLLELLVSLPVSSWHGRRRNITTNSVHPHWQLSGWMHWSIGRGSYELTSPHWTTGQFFWEILEQEQGSESRRPSGALPETRICLVASLVGKWWNVYTVGLGRLCRVGTSHHFFLLHFKNFKHGHIMFMEHSEHIWIKNHKTYK